MDHFELIAKNELLRYYLVSMNQIMLNEMKKRFELILNKNYNNRFSLRIFTLIILSIELLR